LAGLSNCCGKKYSPGWLSWISCAASTAPTIFIRLTGCPLRCVYCDTEYAFVGGERMSLAGILAVCQSFPCQRICLTGGEPLVQPNAIALMNLLLAHGYEISLETSGALSVAEVPTAVSKVMDIKTPSSQEADKNLWQNLPYLTAHDQIKFVIMNRDDYDWSKQIKRKIFWDKVGANPLDFMGAWGDGFTFTRLGNNR
jgi:7-carboxy-7-deazaguanine synthase